MADQRLTDTTSIDWKSVTLTSLTSRNLRPVWSVLIGHVVAHPMPIGYHKMYIGGHIWVNIRDKEYSG